MTATAPNRALVSALLFATDEEHTRRNQIEKKLQSRGVDVRAIVPPSNARRVESERVDVVLMMAEQLSQAQQKAVSGWATSAGVPIFRLVHQTSSETWAQFDRWLTERAPTQATNVVRLPAPAVLSAPTTIADHVREIEDLGRLYADENETLKRRVTELEERARTAEDGHACAVETERATRKERDTFARELQEAKAAIERQAAKLRETPEPTRDLRPAVRALCMLFSEGAMTADEVIGKLRKLVDA